MIILFLSVAFIPGTACADVLRDEAFKGVSADYTHWLIISFGNVPVYDQNGVVTYRGILGNSDNESRHKWYRTVEGIVDNTNSDIYPYFYPEGPVISYGYNLLGTIVVGIYEKADVDNETINDIHGIISAEAEKSGVVNVPVIFVSDIIPVLYADESKSNTDRIFNKISAGDFCEFLKSRIFIIRDLNCAHLPKNS
ncbi:hypothetical protein F1737_06865 [Methanoplanus sp. FWC-SCC4]|uniref:Uncharacterized protein n=1 Tax=Methanochimaera problematica TaxID=2609417 RepID=A0AA97FDB4_9EURY|nr:hypothetical protein [Methanoplanus sp. FWC-SCC4]WOF16442.1 hypothetical protein F1737_06865 [Methanoplanus sp. FWC-SCC4]